MDSSSSYDYYQSSDSDSTSDSSDNAAETRICKRVIKSRNNPLDMYNNQEFKNRFRFSKETFVDILNAVHPHLSTAATNRGQPLSAELKLLIALRFYATGTFQLVLGDHINVSKSSVCRVITDVSTALASLAPDYIRMPGDAEMNQIKVDFHKIAGIPMVCGAIDCTHVRIQSPGGENAEVFRNRKGYFSINVQVVCDAHLRIRDIVARWQGSVHDSTIFNGSRLRAQFENDEFSNCILLGDSAYPCRRYLLTPIQEPASIAEVNYNKAHVKTRSTIERCFGVWKRRFPALMYGLRTKTSTTLTIIIATAVLHNIAKDGDIMEENEEELENVQLPNYNVQQQQNTVVRTTIINQIFN